MFSANLLLFVVIMQVSTIRAIETNISAEKLTKSINNVNFDPYALHQAIKNCFSTISKMIKHFPLY